MSALAVVLLDNKNLLSTGTLTTSDLKNHDQYDASQFDLSASFSGKAGDQSAMQDSANEKKNNGGELTKDDQAASSKTGPSGSAGIGSDSGSQSSTTYAGISGANITITNDAAQALTGKAAAEVIASLNRDVTTGKDGSNSLVKAWDGQQLQQEVQAQSQITAQFGAAAAKEIGDYADKMHEEAKNLRKNAESEADPVKKADMVQAANGLDDNWKEGGTYGCWRIRLPAAWVAA